jgi:hypothetical protein
VVDRKNELAKPKENEQKKLGKKAELRKYKSEKAVISEDLKELFCSVCQKGVFGGKKGDQCQICHRGIYGEKGNKNAPPPPKNPFPLCWLKYRGKRKEN